jgi:hypothetical protein
MKRLYLLWMVCIISIAPACLGVPFDAWTWRNPSTTGNTLTAVAYGDGLFVAVDNSGSILTSPDGIVWTDQFIGTNTLTGVCFGNHSFVAVGGEAAGDGVAVAWSDQGSNPWTQTLTGSGFLNAVACDTNNNEFVAVGNGVATSPDGVTWTPQANASVPSGMNAIAWGADPGDFVAVGSGGRVYYSSDGTNWTAASSGTAYELYGVAYGTGYFQSDGGYGYFVAVGDSVIITSLTASDVSQWTTVSTSDFGSAITYGNGEFVSVDIDERPGTFISTNNGYTFTYANSSSPPPYADGITYGEDQFVAVGDAGLTAYSPDGSNWTSSDFSATTQPLTCGVYGGGLFVAGGGMFGGNGVIVTSTGGFGWALDTDPSVSGYNSALGFTVPSGFVYVNGQFVGVATAYSGSESGVALTSSDGTHWASKPVIANHALNAIAYANVNGIGTYVAVGGSTIVPYSTDNALTWTSNALATNLYTILNAVTYGNGKFVTVGNGGLSAVTSDGVSWITNHASAAFNPTNFNAVAYGNGVFVAVGGESYSYGLIFTSTDGLSWTQQLEYSTFYPGLAGVAYVNGAFIAVGGGGYIFTSPDGLNWTQDVSGTVNNLAAVVPGANQILVLGANGTILGNTLPPPVTESNLAASGQGASFTVNGVPGQTVIVEASTDLIHWTVLEVITIPSGGSVNFQDLSAPSTDKYYRVIYPP